MSCRRAPRPSRREAGRSAWRSPHRQPPHRVVRAGHRRRRPRPLRASGRVVHPRSTRTCAARAEPAPISNYPTWKGANPVAARQPRPADGPLPGPDIESRVARAGGLLGLDVPRGSTRSRVKEAVWAKLSRVIRCSLHFTRERGRCRRRCIHKQVGHEASQDGNVGSTRSESARTERRRRERRLARRPAGGSPSGILSAPKREWLAATAEATAADCAVRSD